MNTIWLSQVAVVLAFIGATVPVSAETFRVYFGTYTSGDSGSKGIYTAVFDSQQGTLTEPVLAAETVNPSFLALHPSGKFLYCVNEVSEGAGRGSGSVTAFTVDAESGMLEKLNSQSSLGGAPCHCVVDATGRWLLVANYSGGNVAVFPITEDGALNQSSSMVQHSGSSVNKQRQEAPHAHSINLSADNQFAYAADLGLDKILIYHFDDQNGILTPNSPYAVTVSPGGGPRHFSLHPDGLFAYSNNELTSSVTAFSRDAETGGLTPLQELSTLPADYEERQSTAECLVHPGGRFVYVSNRGHDSIAVFLVDAISGMLEQVEFEPTGGRTPRNFLIDPTGGWLLAANQDSDNVTLFSIDEETGALTSHEVQIEVPRPVCIRMLAR